MREVTIDGAAVSSREELFGEIYSALGVPGEPGRNLDALYDVLTSLDGVRLRFDNEDALRETLGSYYDRLSAMLDELSPED